MMIDLSPTKACYVPKLLKQMYATLPTLLMKTVCMYSICMCQKKALMPRSRAIFRPRRPRPSVPLRLGVLRPTMAMRGGPGVIALVYVGRWRPARPTPPFLDAFVLAGIGDVDVAPGLARVLLLQDTRVFAGLVVVARVESGGVGVGVHCCFVLSCPLVGVGLDSM